MHASNQKQSFFQMTRHSASKSPLQVSKWIWVCSRRCDEDYVDLTENSCNRQRYIRPSVILGTPYIAFAHQSFSFGNICSGIKRQDAFKKLSSLNWLWNDLDNEIGQRERESERDRVRSITCVYSRHVSAQKNISLVKQEEGERHWRIDDHLLGGRTTFNYPLPPCKAFKGRKREL